MATRAEELELNHALMEVLGLHPDVERADGAPLDPHQYPYSTSLDAVSRAESRLRDAGWRFWGVFDDKNQLPFGAQWMPGRAKGNEGLVTAAAETEPLARARAALLALSASPPPVQPKGGQ